MALVAVPVRAVPCELVTLLVLPFRCLKTEAILLEAPSDRTLGSLAFEVRR